MINKYYNLMPFFDADNGASGGIEPTPDNGTDGNTDDATGKAIEPASLQDLINANPSIQSEIDRRVQQAVATATAKERERQQTIRNKLEDEVIRVSKMTPEEKEAYLQDKANKQAAKREADLTRRELTLDARAALQEKGLPESFLTLLDYTDKEKCLKSIDTIEVAFSAAVQAGVDAKLVGGTTPPRDAGTEGQPADPAKAEYDKKLAEAMAVAGLRTK